MPKFPINLGKSMDSMSEPAMPSKDAEHFPSLYLEWDSDYELPKSGTMTVKFKRASQSNSEDRDGKTRQNVTLDITSIESVSGGKEKSKSDEDEDRGSHLDKLKKEVESEKEDSDEQEY